MRKILIIIISLITHGVYAQHTTKIIYRDTINIRGYIYYDNGKPAYDTPISSISQELESNRINLETYTDSTGYFELKGAKHKDTLIVRTPIGARKYSNHGARFLVLTLPLPKPLYLNPPKPLMVTAISKSIKKPYQFTIKYYEKLKNEIFGGFEYQPEYPGGIDRFYKYVQNNLSYPDKAVRANIEGVVEATFTISHNGSLDNIKITKGLGYGCDEVLLNILTHSAKWAPGKFF